MRLQRGLTMLEVLLATTLMASVTGGLFVMYRNQQKTTSAVLSERQGVRMTADLADRIARELRVAKAITVAGTSSLVFRLPDDSLRSISLAPVDAADPLARPLLLDGEPISQPRLLRNHNPANPSRGLFAQSYLDPFGNATTAPVPLFTYYTDQAMLLPTPVLAPSQIARVRIHLIAHGRLEAPPRYVRTSVALRGRP